MRLSKTLPLITEQAQNAETMLSESLVPRNPRNQYLELELELERERIEQEEMLNFERANVEQVSSSILSAQQKLTATVLKHGVIPYKKSTN